VCTLLVLNVFNKSPACFDDIAHHQGEILRVDRWEGEGLHNFVQTRKKIKRTYISYKIWYLHVYILGLGQVMYSVYLFIFNFGDYYFNIFKK
jgi:hypothetical protein